MKFIIPLSLSIIKEKLIDSLIALNFENQAVRTVYADDNTPLFCLKDVCNILELSNQSNVIASLRDEMYPEGMMESSSPVKKVVLDTEGQLYFVISRSRVQKAKLFRHWVFNKVLPSIRKYGYYGKREQKQLDNKTLLDKLELASMVLNSNKPQELDAYYKALTGESVLEKIKENTPNAN